MELTGKCNEVFENWLGSQTRNTGSDIHKWYATWAKFYIISDSAKWGVYVDFFDSVGIDLVDDIDSCANDFRYLSKVDFKCIDAHNTRPKARAAAIEKANELHNEFLNK